jgi:hypothetical protein
LPEADEIREEIELIETWFRDGAITPDEYMARKEKLVRELLEAVAADHSGRPQDPPAGKDGPRADYVAPAPAQPLARPVLARARGRSTRTGIVVLLLSVVLIVVGARLYFDQSIGFGDLFTRARGGSFEVSVIDVRPAYQGCDVMLEVRNPGDDVLPQALVRLGAVDAEGAVVATAEGSTRDVRSGKAAAVKLFFQNTGCSRITTLRDMRGSGASIMTVSSRSHIRVHD